MIFKSNKFGKKLYFIIVIIIIGVFGSTYFLNNYFLPKYYIYRVKKNVDSIYKEIKSMPLDDFEKISDTIALQNNLTIIITNNIIPSSSNIEEFNESVQLKLNKEKVNLNKFWITYEDLELIDSGEYINKIFYEPKMQSNYFIKLFKYNNKIIIIGTSMANNMETISIINQFNFYIITMAIIVSLLLVWILTRKTAKSIEDLKEQANSIANLKFSNIKINTRDELEELSNSINIMSEKLEKAHRDLEKRNEDLKVLISNISHEVKTPLALIKAYTIGMKDGLDDGTFGDIIIEQVDNTSELVNNLLELSRVQRGEVKKEAFNIIELLTLILEKYKISLKNEKIALIKNFKMQKNCIIEADKKQMEIVLNNLISNAIKYNDGNYIKINFESSEHKRILTFVNKSNVVKKENLDNLWKAFYVVEKSRSKEISGTGLGLSIVANILENNNFKYGVYLNNEDINFYIEF